MNFVLCSVFEVASACLSKALEDCGSELPPPARPAFSFVITSVNFMCVEAFDGQYRVGHVL